nr:MAG TPA: hypothetical protein [Caudoviricetes sp.]
MLCGKSAFDSRIVQTFPEIHFKNLQKSLDNVQSVHYN